MKQNKKQKISDKIWNLFAINNPLPVGGIVISFIINLAAYYFTQNNVMTGLLLMLSVSVIGLLIYFISTKR